MSTNYLLAVQLGWCNGHFLPISIYLVRSNEQHLKFGEQTKHNNFIRHSMSVTDVTINGHEKKSNYNYIHIQLKGIHEHKNINSKIYSYYMFVIWMVTQIHNNNHTRVRDQKTL